MVELWATSELDGTARERALASRELWRSPPCTDVLAFTPDVAVVLTGPVITVSRFRRDGRVDRAELFAPEDVDLALSLFDEWTLAVGAGEPRLASTIATRVLTELADTLGQGGDASSLITSDFLLDDRRPLLEHRIEGSAAALGTGRFISEGRCTCEPLATRGEQVALVRAEFEMDIGSVSALAVGEVDGHGLVQRLMVFDPSDEDAAFAELDTRAIALGGPLASNLPVIAPAMTAINEGDLATLRDGFAPDASFMDHRLARFGAVTIEGFVERAAALLAMGGDVRFRVTEIADATSDAALYFIRASGHAADGGDFELEDWSVVSFRDGRFTRLEQFPADARADAEAAFAGLTPSRDLARTMASRFLERWIASTAVGDRAALAAMAAPDVVMESRRPIVGVSLDGRQDVVSGWELGEQLLGRALTYEALATRGERLGLARVTWHPGDADLSVLAVGEVDAEGLTLVRAVIFEPGDEDAAYAELDARAIALAGDAAGTLRVCFTAIDDLNARRLEVLALHPRARR